MQTRTKILISIAVVAVVAAAAGLLFIYSGLYNVAATDQHFGLTRWVLETTQERSVRAHADELTVSVPADSAALRRGFAAFQQMCVVCHGAPGVERGWMGKGMNPTPPELSQEAAEFSEEELFWIISNGIKMAGMPALSPTHTPEEILEIVAFVDRLPEMSAAEYQAWSNAAAAPAAPSGDGASRGHAGDGHDHTH